MESPLGQILWFWGTSLFLAVLLFFPTSKLIGGIAVRRLEKRLGRASDDSERHRVLRRARLIGGVVAITFAFLFNRALLS
ncbi:MAG: hypothetical protein IID61_09445 [SAR324 cluster bacterium]|nr:hypothetical protein [SAR324 cluster bacterium]